MKLYFSIDALSASADKAWRLQQDQSWRPCNYAEALQENDLKISHQKQAEDWAGRRMQKHQDYGLIAKDRAGIFDFFMRGIFAHSVLHRLSAAPIPAKDQMLQLTASLETGTAWLIYLNTAGQFQALKANQHKIIHNLNIAVRGEISSSAAYIGSQAIDNDELMQQTYIQFLAGWLEHLKTSKMAVFIPDFEKLKTTEEYTQAIQDWQPETTL
ncbi:MAG: hypothetical protein R8K49_01495 [Mariprofundaceae bacterium]